MKKEDRIVSAIFDNRAEAQERVRMLRSAGIPDEAISVVSRAPDEHPDDQHERPDNKASGAAKGLGVGAGVGALFGLSALVIPGVGPFIAAGTLIEALGVVGGAAASGAIVGGTAGGISGLLMKYGVEEDEAKDYERRIREGGVWVAVDTGRTIADADTAEDILRRAGGTPARRRRMPATPA